MPVITFCSNTTKETGKTFSIAALATYMAIEHNYKILLISTSYNDKSLSECFWNDKKKKSFLDSIVDTNKIDLDSGIEGIYKIAKSNRLTPEVIGNYTRIVFKDRLDVLESPNTKIREDYMAIRAYYKDIIKTADRFYDLILVDLDGNIQDTITREIFNISNIIVMNIIQNKNVVDNYIAELQGDLGRIKRKIIPLIGKCDPESKYSVKNIARYINQKDITVEVPYNILFAESCSEGKIVDYFFKVMRMKGMDKNVVFVEALKNLTSIVVEKIKTLQQMKE